MPQIVMGFLLAMIIHLLEHLDLHLTKYPTIKYVSSDIVGYCNELTQ